MDIPAAIAMVRSDKNAAAHIKDAEDAYHGAASKSGVSPPEPTAAEQQVVLTPLYDVAFWCILCAVMGASNMIAARVECIEIQASDELAAKAEAQKAAAKPPKDNHGIMLNASAAMRVAEVSC